MTMSSSLQKAFQAVTAGDSTAVVDLLNDDSSILHGVNDDGLSLLIFAVYNGKKEIADTLLHRGAQLDVFSASAYGALDEITMLVQTDQSLVNSYSPDGWTPLHLASFFGHLLIVEYLVMSRADIHAVSRNGLKNQPLSAATVSNKTDVAMFLLKHGADVHFAQHEGITPLHAASYNGNEELVRLLLANNVDRNVKAENGKTALTMAEERGHTGIVAILKSS